MDNICETKTSANYPEEYRSILEFNSTLDALGRVQWDF